MICLILCRSSCRYRARFLKHFSSTQEVRRRYAVPWSCCTSGVFVASFKTDNKSEVQCDHGTAYLRRTSGVPPVYLSGWDSQPTPLTSTQELRRRYSCIRTGSALLQTLPCALLQTLLRALLQTLLRALLQTLPHTLLQTPHRLLQTLPRALLQTLPHTPSGGGILFSFAKICFRGADPPSPPW
jgi:hypothetical protein